MEEAGVNEDQPIQPESAHDRKQKELAQLALDDLFFFNQYILSNASVMNEEMHREMCDFATRYRSFSQGKKKRLLLEPRYTLKSTCVTIAYPLQLMLRRPDVRILLDSERMGNAKAFLTAIKGHCETNEKYRDFSRYLYGKLPVPSSKMEERWTTSEIISPLRMNKSLKEPTISTGGVDVVKVSQHYDVIIMDDVVSENTVTTAEQIEKTIQHYKLVLSLLDPGGVLIMIGTRWDFGDLYGYIIENHQKYFDVLIRKAYKEDGSLLYPEKLTEEFLQEQRESQGPFIFSGQYLNEPVPREEATFRWDKYHEWYGEVKPEERQLAVEEFRTYTGETSYTTEKGTTLLVNFFITIDPAVSEKETSDPTGMVVCAVDQDNRMFVVETVSQRLRGQEFFDMLFSLVQKYNPKRVGVETTAFQKFLSLNIKDEMRRRGIFFTMEELWSDVDKVRRVGTLQARYEAGQLWVKSGMEELKRQMVNFPRTRYDDLVDALAYQLQVVFPRRKREAEEKERTRWAYLSPITRY